MFSFILQIQAYRIQEETKRREIEREEGDISPPSSLLNYGVLPSETTQKYSSYIPAMLTDSELTVVSSLPDGQEIGDEFAPIEYVKLQQNDQSACRKVDLVNMGPRKIKSRESHVMNDREYSTCRKRTCSDTIAERTGTNNYLSLVVPRECPASSSGDTVRAITPLAQEKARSDIFT